MREKEALSRDNGALRAEVANLEADIHQLIDENSTLVQGKSDDGER